MSLGITLSNHKVLLENVYLPMMGDVEMPLIMSDNLITDPYLIDFHYIGGGQSENRGWILSDAGHIYLNRVQKDYTRIGDRDNRYYCNISTQFMEVDIAKTYFLAINGRANYYNDISFIARNARIRLYDENYNLLKVSTPNGSLFSDYIMLGLYRFPIGLEGTTNFINQSLFIEFTQAPSNTKYIKIEIGRVNASKIEIDIRYVSFNEVYKLGEGERISDYISRNLPRGIYLVDHNPPIDNIEIRTVGAKTGDQIIARDGSGVWLCADGNNRPAKWLKIATETI